VVNNKRILLINPNVYPYINNYANFPLGYTLSDMYPLGLISLAYHIQKNGYETRILDALAFRFNNSQIASAIKEYAPDIVGLNHSIYRSFPLVLNIAELCRKINPRIITVIGGILPSYMDKEILDSSDAIDFIIKGEGEYPFLNLIKSLCSRGDFNNIERLAYRGRGTNVSMEENYNMIPDFSIDPSWINKMFIGGKNLPYFKKGASVYIEASRGCRYSCKFCIVNKFYGNSVVYKEPKSLAGEIEKYMVNFGITSFRFIDSSFTENREFAYNVLEAITNRNLQKKIKWTCSTRVDCIDGKIFKEMKKAGCWRISFGVESYSQQDLDNYNKRIVLDKVKDTFRLAKESGLKTRALLFFNQYKYLEPKELKEETGKVIALSSAIQADYLGYAPLVIYPNTPIYEDYLKANVIKRDGWNSLLNGHLIPTSFISEDHILKLISRIRFNFIINKWFNNFIGSMLRNKKCV